MIVPIPPNQPYTATKSWIESQGSGRAANTDHPYAIVQDHKFIGVVGLHRTHIAKPFELGYWISPEAWHHGFATEAARALLQNLDKMQGLQDSVSGYFADNPPSGHVLDKLGYKITAQDVIYSLGRAQNVERILMKRKASETYR